MQKYKYIHKHSDSSTLSLLTSIASHSRVLKNPQAPALHLSHPPWLPRTPGTQTDRLISTGCAR